MKRFLPFAGVVLLLVLIAFAFRRCHRGTASDYQTAIVAHGSITQAVTATGTLNPVLNVQVGSQISGNIQKLFADFNSQVKAGQVIAQIDPAVFQANVMQAEGDVANAHAALELARLNSTRTQALVAKQNSAQSELDQSLAALHQAEAAVKIKEGALAKAKVDLDHCTITSPIDGMVISRNVDVGQTVAASLQAPVIFTIANDLTKMQIDANVAEADVGVVTVDQNVEFTVDAFPYRTFRGQVVQVRNAPITVQNVVTYDTVIAVSNPELKLKPGMTANVSIVIAHRDDVLKVNNAAFRFRPPGSARVAEKSPSGVARVEGAPAGGPPSDGSGRARGGGGAASLSGSRGGSREARDERTIYVLPDRAGEPKAVQAKVGISDGINTELTSGLKEGDRVVTGITSATPAAGSSPATNPFGGGQRRGF